MRGPPTIGPRRAPSSKNIRTFGENNSLARYSLPAPQRRNAYPLGGDALVDASTIGLSAEPEGTSIRGQTSESLRGEFRFQFSSFLSCVCIYIPISFESDRISIVFSPLDFFSSLIKVSVFNRFEIELTIRAIFRRVESKRERMSYEIDTVRLIQRFDLYRLGLNRHSGDTGNGQFQGFIHARYIRGTRDRVSEQMREEQRGRGEKGRGGRRSGFIARLPSRECSRTNGENRRKLCH